MIITSKYSGTCTACKGPYKVGERISWIKGTPGTRHALCSDEGKEIAEKVAVSRATDSAVHIPCPEGKAYLPYQRAGIAFAKDRKGTLIADEMGLGKTIQAIGVINANPEIVSVLVVCPASLKINWRNELDAWLTRPSVIRVVNGQTIKKRDDEDVSICDKADVSIIVVNFEQVKKLGDASFDLLIVDEAHYCKNAKALRTKQVRRMAKLAKRVILLSGTPITNRPIELWSLLQIVDADTWDPPGKVKGKNVGAGEDAGFFRFVKRYAQAHREHYSRSKPCTATAYGRCAYCHWDFSGAANLDELQEKLRTSCMVRRLKADVLKELPSKRRQAVVLPSTYVDDDYGVTSDNYEETIRTLRGNKVAFAEISAKRHEQGLSKVDAVIDHVVNCLESDDGKIVLFAHHLDVIEGLRAGLAAYGCVVITGAVDTDARQHAVDVFQQDPNCRVIVGSIGAMGVGLTLTASSHVVFAELDWTPGNVSQAEDRCHRIGQRDSVLVHHLVLDGTLDAKMTKILVKKQGVISAGLDTEASYGQKLNGTTHDDCICFSDPFTAEHATWCDKKTAEKPLLTEEEISRIHGALRTLSERCDGAQSLDGAGFNKLDAPFGHSLASKEQLTIKQALAARRMLVKYRKQIGDVLTETTITIGG